MSFNIRDYMYEDSAGLPKFDFKKSSFCPAFWMALYYKGNNQGLKPCCSIEGYATRTDQGNPIEPTIDNYNKTDFVQELKQTFLNNKFHKNCHTCVRDERHGQQSDRMAMFEWIKTWEDVDRLQCLINNDKLELWHLDYRPSNLCNLKCRMCDPVNSSLIVKENMQNDLKLDMIMGDNMYNDAEANEWNYIKDVNSIKNLKSLKVLGGEPTVEKKVFDMLDLIQEKDLAKNINLQYTTNATNLNKAFYQRLKGYKSVNTTFSLDATGRTYEYIRTPAKWSSVHNNLMNYIEFRKENDPTTLKYGCSINCVISVYNMFTLDEWYEELNELLFSLGGRRITMIYCTNEWQALDILPDFALHKMKDSFNNLSNAVKEYDHTKVLGSYIDRAINEDYNEDKQRLLSTFFWHNNKLDSVRKTKLVDIAPVFNEIKEYADNNLLQEDLQILTNITEGNKNRKWKNWKKFLQNERVFEYE